jgi:predicted DNA-binding transcriptional regulator YafY
MTERFVNTPKLVKEIKENYLKVEIKSVNQPELEKLLLTSGGEFKIISPIELKEEICSIAQTILKNNS